jgi:TRAP-type uncharacterized transport system substrate-binding protein
MHPGAARCFEEKGLRVPVLTADAGEAFLQRYRTSSEAIAQVNKNSVGLITGPAGETSARAASELTMTLSSDDLRVVAMTSNGSELTASILFDHLRMTVDRQYLDPYTALEQLRSGEIAAAVFVSGKPVTVLDGVEFIDGLHLLPVLSPPKYGDTYRKASFSPYDYPALVEPGEEIPTFAVRTALVAYNCKSDHVRYESAARLVETLFENLPRLQTSGHQAKLREINLRATVDGFPRFAPAERWLEAHSDPGTAPQASADEATPGLPPVGGPLQQAAPVKNKKMTPTF